MDHRIVVKKLISAAVVSVGLLCASSNVAAANVGEDLVVVVPEGTAKPPRLSAAVAGWRAELGRQDVIWVDSLKREQPSGFASMAVLNFTSNSQLAAWKRASAATLPAGLRIVDVDVLAEGGTASAKGGEPVYKISYYTLTSPREQFQAWVDGYLVKYLDAQVRHRILNRYAMYLEAGQAGRALLVLEYADAATERSAEPIKEKLSEEIAHSDQEYARQSSLKESLRTTQSWTLAVPAK